MIGMFASSEVVDYNTWMNAMLLAFDERNASPLANLGSLGSGFNATATNTRRFTNSSSKAHIWLPIGVSGRQNKHWCCSAKSTYAFRLGYG